MKTIALLLTALVSVEHLYFMWLEMVSWKARAPRLFRITTSFAKQSAGLASNQGLYNGFLAAALILGILLPDPGLARAFRIYGLVCVVLAGLWGGWTIQRRIYFIQALPGLIALLATLAVE